MILLSVLLHLVLLWILPGPSFVVPTQDDPDEPMKLGLQTIREPDRQEDPRESEAPSVNPSSSSRDSADEPESTPSETDPSTESARSETTRTPPPEPASGSPEDESEEENREPTSPPQSQPDPDERGPTDRQPDQAETGDEPVPSGSSGPTDGSPPESEESTEPEDTPEFLRKGTSFPTDMAENEQGSGGKQTGPRESSVQESVQRYRTVETVRASDTRSLEVVLSDTQSGDQSDTTPVEVPRITVNQDAPESPATEEPRPSSRPVSPRRPTVDRKILKQPLPEVPDWLERTGEDVRVVLRYAIDREGNVSSIDVLGSSGYPALDDRSIERLGAWKYEAGTPVNEALTVFEFRLE